MKFAKLIAINFAVSAQVKTNSIDPVIEFGGGGTSFLKVLKPIVLNSLRRSTESSDRLCFYIDDRYSIKYIYGYVIYSL